MEQRHVATLEGGGLGVGDRIGRLTNLNQNVQLESSTSPFTTQISILSSSYSRSWYVFVFHVPMFLIVFHRPYHLLLCAA